MRNTKPRRIILRRLLKNPSLQSTEESNTSRRHPKKSWMVNQKIMSSTLERVKSLKARSVQRHDQNIPKMVSHLVSVGKHDTDFAVVNINNHTSVWGSWYDVSSGAWGYGCCHSSVHMSYCAGQAGKEASYASTAQALLASSSNSTSNPSAEEAASESRGRIEQNYSKKRVGEGDISLDKDRLAEALSEEKKRKARGGEDEDRFSKKKKGLEVSGHDVTEEELGELHVCVYGPIPIVVCPCRGLPDESSEHGRSNGQLCGHRGPILTVRCSLVALFFVHYAIGSVIAECRETYFVHPKWSNAETHRDNVGFSTLVHVLYLGRFAIRLGHSHCPRQSLW